MLVVPMEVLIFYLNALTNQKARAARLRPEL